MYLYMYVCMYVCIYFNNLCVLFQVYSISYSSYEVELSAGRLWGRWRGRVPRPGQSFVLRLQPAVSLHVTVYCVRRWNQCMYCERYVKVCK